MLTRFKCALLLGLALLAAPLVSSACCPSDGNGNPKRVASVGLGENFPATEDLAADSSWSVYEFERDGVQYFQINDTFGLTRAAVGRIDGAFWVLPIGADADRVSVPGGTVVIPPYTSARRIYLTEALTVWAFQTASGTWWAVRPPATR